MLRAFLAMITMAGGVAFSGPAMVSAGYAPGEVSGYVVSGVDYDDAGEPGWVHAVGLTLDKAATKVDARLDKAAGWASCSLDNGRRWRCALATPVAVADIKRLQVAASG